MFYLLVLFFEILILKIISLMIKFHSGALWSFVFKDIILQKEANPRGNQLLLVSEVVYKPKNLPLV